MIETSDHQVRQRHLARIGETLRHLRGRAGAISDRTRSRLGRRHPYMLATAVPLGIVFYLVWVPPSGIFQDALVVWLVFWLLVLRLLSTFYAGQS